MSGRRVQRRDALHGVRRRNGNRAAFARREEEEVVLENRPVLVLAEVEHHAHGRRLAYVGDDTATLAVHRRMCPECMKTFERKPKDVLPRVQIGNRLGAQCLYDHYVGGMTLGALARRLGLRRGSLASFEKVAANLLEKTIDRLTEEYRSARAKHADETTWRCDGRNGYDCGGTTRSAS